MALTSPSCRAASLVLALGLVLAACGGNGGTMKKIRGVLGTEKPPCPPAVVLSDARHIFIVTPGGRGPNNVRVAGRITIPVAECSYDDGKVFVDLSLPFDLARGPRLPKGRAQFEVPYFVAVADRRERILAKEVFVTQVRMGGDQDRTAVVEVIEQIIPLRPGQKGTDFVIYVGFQLTPEQVEFNRINRF